MTEHTPTQTAQSGETHWLDRPDTPKRLWTGFAVVLAVLVIAELFVTHNHEGFMFNIGFHAWFGLLIGFGSIVISKGWKKLLKRKDTYYDR